MTHASAQSAPERAPTRLTHQGDVERLPALRPGYCDECGERIGKQGRARNARFCSAACRKAWWITARNRGAQIYQMVMIWRMTRGRKGTRGAGMIGKISALVDGWVRLGRGD